MCSMLRFLWPFCSHILLNEEQLPGLVFAHGLPPYASTLSIIVPIVAKVKDCTNSASRCE